VKKLPTDDHFNPFPKAIAKLLIKEFEKRPLLSLPPESTQVICGVYGLYYFGNNKAYRNLTLKDTTPIYVGKAVAPGGRKGGGDASKAKGNFVIKRLKEHSISILGTKTLSLKDFKCRWLSVEPNFVGSAESILIDHYKPIWNRLIPGFGIHTPGSGRAKQACSDWDSLHPGRKFAIGLPKGNSTEALMERIKQFLKVSKINQE
jgi:Eco29kI restriction endonuclease